MLLAYLAGTLFLSGPYDGVGAIFAVPDHRTIPPAGLPGGIRGVLRTDPRQAKPRHRRRKRRRVAGLVGGRYRSERAPASSTASRCSTCWASSSRTSRTSTSASATSPGYGRGVDAGLNTNGRGSSAATLMPDFAVSSGGDDNPRCPIRPTTSDFSPARRTGSSCWTRSGRIGDPSGPPGPPRDRSGHPRTDPRGLRGPRVGGDRRRVLRHDVPRRHRRRPIRRVPVVRGDGTGPPRPGRDGATRRTRVSGRPARGRDGDDGRRGATPTPPSGGS